VRKHYTRGYKPKKQISNTKSGHQNGWLFYCEDNMHKREEIIAAIKTCAERLGRAPSQAEFRRASKISWYQVYKHFRGMRQAVRAAGLEPGPRGSALDVNALTLDWAGVVRKLRRLPSRAEYCEHGIHHAGTLHARIVWSQMAHKFVLLVREFHLEGEWADVVNIVVGKFPLLGDLPQRTTEESTVAADWRRKTQIGEVGRELTRVDTNENREPQRSAEAGGLEYLPLKATDNTDRQHGGMKLGKVVTAALAIEILMATMGSGQQSAVSNPPEQSDWNVANSKWQEHNKDQAEALVNTDRACAGGPAPCGRPVVYGEPLGLAAMAHAPTNELGVLFLFGIVAADLGFRVERLQAAFPDCEAKRATRRTSCIFG
jgi:hypothetical protein